MSVTVSEGPAVVIGYQYKLQVATDLALFPSGSAITAHVRAKVSDTAILATLTTANGGLVRVSDTLIEIVIAAAQTAAIKAGTVHMDMVRTDLTPDLHLGFNLEIPVVMPVTRGLTE